MRRLFLVAVALAAGLATLPAAAPPPAPPGLVEAAATDDTQDVLYVGQPYPVLIRLHLRVDDRSVFARWDAFMANLHRLLDRNGSGALDRNEAARAPQPQQMQAMLNGNAFTFAPPRVMPGRAGPNLDSDGDGGVSLDELKEFYAKNGCGPVLLVGGYDPYAAARSGDSLSDAIFNLLDTDKDGKLSRAELGAAERAFRRFDIDDNELVSQQELGSSDLRSDQLLRIQLELELLARARQLGATGRPSHLVLIPREEQGRRAAGMLGVAREVIGRYDTDKDGKLSREEIAFPREQFAGLDRNKDGKLDVLELSRWVSARPAGEFTLALAVRGAMPPQPRGGTPPPAVRDMTVDLEGVRINVVGRAVPTNVVRADPFILEQFRQLDRDKQGFITRKQVEAGREGVYFRGLFELADTNGDNRLSEAEVKAGVAVLSGAATARVALTLSPSGQGLFQALDANGDGQLSIREMRNAWGRLAAYDRDGDGAMARAEFPRQLVLAVGPGLTSGNIAPPAALARTGRVVTGGRPVAAARGPVWFRKMDRNGDGDVSPAEWLGSQADFGRADADGDGLISPEEAEAFDAKMRKN